MARETKIAAIFGHPTRLLYAYRFARRQDWPTWLSTPKTPAEYEAADWSPSSRLQTRFNRFGDPFAEPVPDWQTHGFVRKRWVYVFAYDEATRATALYAELWADLEGRVSINPHLSGPERFAWQPPSSAEAEGPELPRLVSGRKRWVAVIAVPYRLTDACIAALCKDNAIVKQVGPVDLSDRRLLETDQEDLSGGKAFSEEYLALPVVAPLDVARQLSADINHARSRHLTVLGRDGEFHDATKEDRTNAQKYTFSRALQALVDDPDVGGSLENDFGPGKLDELRQFVTEHERQLTQHAFLAEAIGAELVAWLRRPLVQQVMDGCHPEDGERLLRFVSEIMSGLGHTAAGLRYLGRLRSPHLATTFMGKMFDSSKLLGGEEFEIATRGLQYFASSLSVVHQARLVNLEASVQNVLHEMDTVYGQLTPGWKSDWDVATRTLEEVSLRPPLDGGKPRRIHVKATAVAARATSIEQLGKRLGHADVGFQIIDALNVALAMRAYFATEQTRGDLRAKRGLAAVASGAGLLRSIFDKVFELAGRKTVPLLAYSAVRIVGFAVAVHTFCVGAAAAVEALDREDYDAMVAVGASTGFTVASGVTSLIAVVVESSIYGMWGVALAMLGGLAYLVYVGVKDSHFETLVLFSAYGEEQHRQAAGTAEWSPVPLGELADSWRSQSLALGALQRQFAVGLGDYAYIEEPGRETAFRQVRIFVGYCDDSTTFELTWKWRAKHGSNDEVQHWGDRAAGGDEGRDYRTCLAGFGRELYFDVNIPEAAWRDGGFGRTDEPHYGGLPFEDLTVSVRKIYQLDGTKECVPLRSSVFLTIHRGSTHTNPSTKVLSMEAT